MSGTHYTFLDGTRIAKNQVKGIKDLLLNHSDLLPDVLLPVWADSELVLRQDLEIPLPGFFILATVEDYDSLGDVSESLAAKIAKVSRIVQQGMRKVLPHVTDTIFI